MRILIPLFLSAALGLGGCTRSVTTCRCDPNQLNSGVVYSLPKTLLKVSITYSVEKETTTEAGIVKSETYTAVIRKPIVVEPILAADPQSRFVLSGEGLTKDAALDASFKFQVDDNLLLAGVTAEATDKAPEILQAATGAALSALKIAAMAGPREVTPLKEVSQRLAAINQEIAALTTSQDPKRFEQLEALQKEQQVWLAFVARYRELNSTKMETRDVVYTRILDLGDFTWAAPCWKLAGVKAPAAMLGNVTDAGVPAVTVEVFACAGQGPDQTPAMRSAGEKGVVYRVPTLLRTRITLGPPSNAVLFDDHIRFAQVGPLSRVEARYKTFGKRKTTMVFSAATGSLKEYGVEATSSAEAAAKAVDTSLTKVQTALGEIKKAQDAAEAAKKTPEQVKLADFEMQKKLAEAEAALLDAQQKLEKTKAAAGAP
jgi:hypothetical protein